MLTTVATGSGVISSAPAGINCGATCSGNFNAGSSVVLTATPAAGHRLSGWRGACSGTAATCRVTMSAAQAVTATFAAVVVADTTAPTVSISSPSASGTYTSANANLSLSGNAGDKVRVTQVSWSNNRGGSGTATLSGTTAATWSVASVALQTGTNTITMTARDAAGNSAASVIVVTYGTNTQGGVTYYFSDCQSGAAAGCVAGSNTNPGTETSPKQTMAGIDVNTLPAGSQLLFNRGGAWNWNRTIRLDNRNATAEAPLTFGAYGTGPQPLLLVSSTFGFETGEWNNTTPDGGYVFHGLKFEGTASAPPDAKAIWLRGTVSDVLIEDVEFTNFFIALYGQGQNDIQRVTVRNSRFIRNKSMGVLGTFNNSLFEENLFERNNITGSGFEHGTYFSNFTNLTLRNNFYNRNSVINGVCQGGNMTFHGQVDGLLIEGNRIEQDAAEPGCWLMSITQGYASAEWFRNVVVRNNTLINGGNTGIAAQSSPGILVEDNVIINTQTTPQTAISVGHTDYPNGDVPDGNAVVRNNTACYPTPNAGSSVVHVTAPNSTVSDNVTLTGAAATMGDCAR